MWEDAANKQGGRWVITLNKSSKSDLDNLWLDVVSIQKNNTMVYLRLHKYFMFSVHLCSICTFYF